MTETERADWIEWMAWKIEAIRAGRSLLPIHELRTVATDLGLARGDFDAVLREMRRDGLIRLRAISDYRKMTRQQLADSIEGVNETLAYVA